MYPRASSSEKGWQRIVSIIIHIFIILLAFCLILAPNVHICNINIHIEFFRYFIIWNVGKFQKAKLG